MSALSFTPSSYVGSVELPNADFLALITYESYKGPRSAVTLFDKLDKQRDVSLYDIEYNGHFGAQIIFTVDVEDIDKLDPVFEIITTHIDACKAWLNENGVSYA